MARCGHLGVLGLALAPLLLAACVVRSPHSIVAESRPLGDLDRVTVLGPAHGTSCSRRLLFFPIAVRERFRTAIENALAGSGGDAVMSVTADTVEREFLLYADHCLHVRGTAVALDREG